MLLLRPHVFAFLLAAVPCAVAQSPQQAAVQVTATVTEAPPAINFAWPVDASATGYTVSRRLPGEASWGTPVVIPGGGAATSWVDTDVVTGARYEYRFLKTASWGQGRGFISSGITLPVVDARGRILLIVDASQAAALATEIKSLYFDLIGDGWLVTCLDVAPTDTVANVKTRILELTATHADVKALFLLGHVPVPYSGNAAPDGHSNHVGAWSADLFYGELDGVWTDTTVNNSTASRPENRNVPGDGKYDQTTIPSDVDLMVGRVDLAKMPAFPATETELLRAYLGKNQAYRYKKISVDQRAVIDDNFGWFSGEAFAATGWRNFSTLLGPANVVAGDYFTLQNTTAGGGYAWSYGCGGGSYTSAGGIGTTSDFVTSTNRNVFTILFGSYFGDWDSNNNFLRAPLCSGWTLTSFWAGRPHWTFHSMGMGLPIGDGARYSQNDTSVGGGYTRRVHIALMGDPTLRQHIIAPPRGVRATSNQVGQVRLGWSPSPDEVAGYHVYRASTADGPYHRLTKEPVVGTSYADTPWSRTNSYMVKATRLEVSPSGSYWNTSQGITAQARTLGGGFGQSLGSPCGVAAPELASTPLAPGRTWTLAIDGGEPNGLGQVLTGTLGTPVPIEGCELYLLPSSLGSFVPVLLDRTGAWSVTYTIPNDRTSTGITLDLQAAVVGSYGLALSNALHLVIGE